MNRPKVRTMLVLAGLAAAAGVARAENYGRVTQPSEVVTTSIFPKGDVDDVVFDAPAGWKLQAVMKNKGQVVLPPPDPGQTLPPLTPLLPRLQLIAPDGNVTTTGVVAKATKKAASLKATLAAGGRFALRLDGTDGTGVVELKWKLVPSKVAPFKKVPLDANTTTFYEFPARGGALVSWTLTFKGDGAPSVTKILDPDGNEVPFDPNDAAYVTRKSTSEVAKSFPIPASFPGGQFKLQVENKVFTSTMNLVIKVAMPKLPPAPVSLSRLEPVLTAIGRSGSGCGVVVPLTGLFLDPSPKGVFFGKYQALSASVSEGAAETDPDTCNVGVPGGTGTVDVVFVASDGQVAVLPQAFTFSPPPVLTSFDPDVGPGVGNVDLTITGSGFETEGQDLYKIIVGGVQASEVKVLDDHTITCKTPANVAGPKQVILRDKCNEDVIAPGTFTYTTGLNISNVIPSAVPVFGGVPVVVYGTGFLATNQVYIDGNLVASTPVSFQGSVIGHKISGPNLPGHAAGKVDVKVVQGGNQAVKVNGLAYYMFTDVTATAIPAASATDDWGGVSTAVADTNADGTIDYIFISDGQALSATRPGTRILKNNGSGVFTDATDVLMPSPTPTEGYGANRVLANNFNTADSAPDLYLSRPGTGTEARRTGDHKFIDAFGLVLFGATGGGFNPQSHSGSGSKLVINGTLTQSNCYVYDYDFRSVNAGLGDLDGDLDLDIALVNDKSIASFIGANCNSRWLTCAGGYYSACYSFIQMSYGSALRLCTVSSSGSVVDRTTDLLKAAYSPGDDFRGVSVAVGDMNGDFLNDIVVTHNTFPGGTLASCTRIFKQTTSGSVISYTKMSSSFLAVPVTNSDDDWRGDFVTIPDLNGDLYRDLVVALDDVLPNGRTFSTRILIQDPANGKLVDRTDALLTGNLPAGDNGRAKYVYAQDLDRDGDADLILVTPNSTGAGNPQTRYLLNTGKDIATGIPNFINATSILPVFGSDPGNGVVILSADIDGDGDLDLIITDTHQTSGTPVKRTRIWRQDR